MEKAMIVNYDELPYTIALYYGKWAIFNMNGADHMELCHSGKAVEEKDRIQPIELFDTRIEADRFVQGVIHAMQEMNAL
jgi:hypothetical protein